MNNKSVFLHERLYAYLWARKFYQTAKTIRDQLPRGLGEVADQLKRASSSLSLALAEGANALAPKIKALHFRRGLASAGECAGALDQIEDEGAAPVALLVRARHELKMSTVLTLGLVK